MKGVKELKARLKSIGNIRKITSTMELVAGAKLRRLQDRALSSRPYASAIRKMIAQVTRVAPENASPLLAVPDKIERECLIVIAADRGLCGAFNANIFRKAHKYLREREAAGVKMEVYTFGRRSARFFDRVRADVLGNCEDSVEKIGYRRVAGIMGSLVDDYLEGRIQKVSVLYTWFKSAVSFQPILEPLLPFEPEAAEGEREGVGEDAEAASGESDYIMEPSPEAILAQLLPKSLEMRLFAGILESLASEYAARRIAMKNATDAADDMSEELTMEYNKARQAGITGDLLDIVAGAEAQAG